MHADLAAIVLLAGAAATPVATGAFVDLPALDGVIARFLGEETGSAGGARAPLDSRLRLARCSTPPVLSWRSAAHDNLVVECADRGSWRLFVPVLGGAAVAAEAPSVRRGDAVVIAVSGDGFTVSQPGEAMEDGRAGGWIRVLPASARSAREAMRARVERAGLVTIPLS